MALLGSDASHEALAAVLDEMAHSCDVQDVVLKVRARFGVHATYQLVDRSKPAKPFSYAKSSYPAGYIAEYLVQNLWENDPFLREGFQRMEAFDWRTIPQERRPARLIELAHRFGLGANGFCWPFRDDRGRRALFTVNDGRDEPAWDGFLARHRDELGIIAARLHARVMAEQFDDGRANDGLTKRELDCLAWAAKGKSAGVTAAILGLSPHTTRGYLKSARMKLKASSIQQAVAVAVARGLVSF